MKEVKYVYREGNQCANFLTNLAYSCPRGTTLLIYLLDGLIPLIKGDMLG